MLSGKMFEVKNTYDVIVVGGGLSGICAAVSAAREGAKTVLIERYGILGGMLTSGNVYPILGMVSAGTIYDEMIKLLGKDGQKEIVSGNGRGFFCDWQSRRWQMPAGQHDFYHWRCSFRKGNCGQR